MTEIDNKDQLDKLKSLVDILNASLPNKIPFDFSLAIDPVRAVVFRESCLHRIAEISESTYDAYAKDNLVVAAILSRAIMETKALFREFINEVKEALNPVLRPISLQKLFLDAQIRAERRAQPFRVVRGEKRSKWVSKKGFWREIGRNTGLKSRSIEKIRKFLTSCSIGVKSPQLKKLKSSENVDLIADPTNILTLINKRNKKNPYYRLHYDFLSEFSHPNAAGTVDAYVSLDHEARVARLGKNRSKLVPDLTLPQLIELLTIFLDVYDFSAKLLEEFTYLCNNLLNESPRSRC